MSEADATQEAQGRLFAEMDAAAREVVERRFGVRLDSHQSSQKLDAAWDVYQNTSVKLMTAIRNRARIDNPRAYGATVARHTCCDHWRHESPEWTELKGRLRAFFKAQSPWALWDNLDQLGPMCAPAEWRDKPMAEGERVAALLDRPRRIEESALPASTTISALKSNDWDRLLQGFFKFLRGPVRLDDLVSITGVLFGVMGSRFLAFNEIGGPEEDGPVFDPASSEPSIEGEYAMREIMLLIWAELKTMPKRYVVPFLLNPPVPKGLPTTRIRNKQAKGKSGAVEVTTADEAEEPLEAEVEKTKAARPERGEVLLFVKNGAATATEIGAMIGFSADQFATLWRELQIEAKGGPPLEAVPDAKLRFAIVWNYLPLEDRVIARVMGLATGQMVINLRNTAKDLLARMLRSKKIGAGG